MRVLFYVEPLTERDTPTWKKAWVHYVDLMIKSLGRDGSDVECCCVIGDGLEGLAKATLRRCDIVTIHHAELVPRFGRSALTVATNWYRGASEESLRDMAELLTSRLGDFTPDACITFSPAPFVGKAYSTIPVLYFELGFVSRPPFPETGYLDPFGMFNNSYPLKRKEEIADYSVTECERRLVTEVREAYLPYISAHNPLFGLLRPSIAKFDSAVLLALQFSQFYGYDAHADFPDQYDLIIQTLSIIPPNIALVVVEHPQYPILSEETLGYLKSRHENLIWFPQFRELSSASQYIIESIDLVITVSSSVGLQAMLWRKPLIVLGHSHLDIIADSHSLHDVVHLIGKPWPLEKERVLAWQLSRYSIPFGLLFDCGVFGQRIRDAQRCASSRDYTSFFKLPFGDLDQIKSAYLRNAEVARPVHSINVCETELGGLTPLLIDRDGEIAELNQAVAVRDGEIAELNQAVAVRDGEIANLKEAVVYRDGQIGSLNQALADRDERITSLVKQVIVEGEANIAILKQELAERDGLIESKSRIVSDLSRQLDHLSEMVAKRDGQIAKLRSAITDREAAINELKASTSWRVTRPLRTFKGLLLRRGNIADREEEISPQSSNQQTGGGPRAGHAAGILLDHQHRYHLADHPTGYTYIPPRRPDDFERIFKAMERRPTFSIVVPVYNTPSELLLKAIGSVTSQWYPHWELILADDASPSERTKEDLARIDDQRIVVLSLPTNQGIAGATNAALARATGEYVVLLDHDDELTEDCLFELALCINRDRPDYIYSDEDKISPDGLYTEPHFKPDWSPDTMMSTMFVCHVSCIRRSLLIEIGGLRSDYDGCQDWDMVLRLAEKTDRITHIPKVLYHWRIIPASTAADIAAKPYVLDASRRVREDALNRRGLAGTVEPLEQLKGYFRVNYHPRGEPLISIIIPSRDNGEVLSRCLDSIVESSSYRNFELIVLDNGSIEPTTLAYLDRISSQAQTAVIRHDAPFNFSELNNIGFNASRGDLLLFLNDDTEVISADWLERMAGFAQLTHVGAVGAKLLYPGGREVQHAGVVNLEDGPNHAFIRQDADNPCYFVRNLLEYNWLAVTGACLMVEREKFQSVGGFDETFPIAYNDVDLCFRLRDAGYFNVVCQSVRLIHHESVSRGLDHLSTQKLARLEREKRHLFEVHPHYFQRDPFHNPNLHPNGLNFEIAG